MVFSVLEKRMEGEKDYSGGRNSPFTVFLEKVDFLINFSWRETSPGIILICCR